MFRELALLDLNCVLNEHSNFTVKGWYVIEDEQTLKMKALCFLKCQD
jgi:hypothetical protein